MKPKPYDSSFRREFSKGREDDDEHLTAFNDWQAAGGTPEGNAKFLQSVEPVLQQAAITHAGDDSPVTLGKAKLIALDSIGRYDPSRSSVKTYLYNQMTGLRRATRQQTRPISTAERVTYGRAAAQRAESELEHEFGRPPTADEIAGHIGVSTDRLATFMATRPGASEGSFEDDEDVGGPLHEDQKAWVDLVHSDLDPYHKLVLEFSLGLHGRRRLSNTAIAEKLGRSPGAISQAKAKIQKMLNDADELSPFGQ